jgi:hypothetical protein
MLLVQREVKPTIAGNAQEHSNAEIGLSASHQKKDGDGYERSDDPDECRIDAGCGRPSPDEPKIQISRKEENQDTVIEP